MAENDAVLPQGLFLNTVGPNVDIVPGPVLDGQQSFFIRPNRTQQPEDAADVIAMQTECRGANCDSDDGRRNGFYNGWIARAKYRAEQAFRDYTPCGEAIDGDTPCVLEKGHDEPQHIDQHGCCWGGK